MTKNYKLIEEYLINFLRNEVLKTGLKKCVLGLSGGIDSAVVAVLCKKAFGSDMLALMLPSQFSSSASVEDAKALCEKFDIPNATVSIAPLISGYFENHDQKLRVGNFSARMRMAVLYDYSASMGALVIGTSNKSELMLGYGTIHGDLASAINPIGDLYKSEIFEFAAYLGINESIIKKPPSADLYEGQSDEAELGYSYKELDEVLRLLIEERYSKEELLARGFKEELVKFVYTKVFANQFKRVGTVIAKLTSRSIGHDFLYPRDIMLQNVE